MPVPGTLKKTTVKEDELAATLSDKFGIDPWVTRVYLWLVQNGPSSSADLTKSFTALSSADGVLENMVSQGLVIRSAADNAPRYQALHPRMSMTNIFKVYEKELVQNLRDRRAVLDRIVNLLTPIYEEQHEHEKK